MRVVPLETNCPRVAPHAILALFVIAIATAAPIAAQSEPTSAPATRPGKIFGQVLMPDGKPAAGASVKVFRPRLPSVPAIPCRILPEADHDEELLVTCDANGNFSAPARPGETHGLLATDGGELMSDFADWFCAGDSAILRLGPTRVIEGSVVLAEEGKAPVPAPGRRVCAYVQDSGLNRWVRAPIARLETRSGPDGRWSLRVPNDVTPSIRVVEEEQPGGRTLALGSADGGAIEITPRRIVRGRLVEKANGRPVAGALVHWANAGTGTCVASDGEGRFALEAIPSGTRLHVIPKVHERTVATASGEEEAQIELSPAGARMTARLLRDDGSPLGGARVILSGPVQAGLSAFTDLSWVHVLPADGRLELGCLQHGEVIMGFVEVDGTFVQFLAACPSEDVALGDVKVSIRGRVEGRVVAPDGSPLRGAIVLVRPRLGVDAPLLQQLGGIARATVADRAGRFVVDGLAPGPCSLGACAPGIVPAELQTTASPQPKPVVLQLERGQALAGRVVDEDGKPVPGVRVYVTFQTRANRAGSSFGGTILPVLTDERGAFLIQGISDKDRLLIWAIRKRGGPPSQPLEVGVGAGVEILLPSQK